MTFLQRCWYSLNYRYCKASEYLAMQRGDGPAAAEFGSLAMEWGRKYIMAGRRMV